MSGAYFMFLGLDLGTSGLKAVALDSSGSILGQASSGLSVSNPHPLWSEQDPNSWWTACVDAVSQLKKQGVDLSSVKSIGLSGQMHGATLIDEFGKPLRPCILWNDGRSFQECQELTEKHPEIIELSGNLIMPGFTAPKLSWVAKHEPEIFKKTKKVLLPKDYLSFKLTGVFASDMSDAAGTLWLNPEKRDWDEKLLNATGLSLDHMPTLFEGNQVIGELSNSVANELGLPVVPVVAGAGDNAAGAVGVGVTEPGQAMLSLGTSGVIFTVSESHMANPENTVHAFCHCLPERWHQMSVILSAANCLSWLSKMTSTPVGTLMSELDESGIQTTQTTFLPYLSGERTPHNDPTAKGMFHGLTNGAERYDLTLSVLEGVSFAFADGLDALVSAGVKMDTAALIGGGAQSKLWRQQLADILQKPLVFRDGGEVGPGLGAARLAQLGYLNKTDTKTIAEICPQPEILDNHSPSNKLTDYYQEKREIYKNLYQLTKTLNSTL